MRRSGSVRRVKFMRSATVLGGLLAGLGLLSPEAEACGGFFCGQQPVDQTAERILFEVGEDSLTMTTQIAFNGRADDFAWILPLSEVPAADSLSLFPQRALTALDAGSGPLFQRPDDPACYGPELALPTAAADEDAAGGGAVSVLVRAEVGPYGVAVVESRDPQALVDWLRTENYRITPAMEPYIRLYTEEGLKFLALKLRQGAEVKDIQPFRFTLPGTSPTIPLRMTALAAEPEMSILVFVLGQGRYEGKNWENVDIANDKIRYNPFVFSFPMRTNWSNLVAQAVDAAGGQGWVTEYAGTSQTYRDQVSAQLMGGFFPAPEDEEAARALLGVLEGAPYLTRLYTRLSAEEMTRDPVLGLSALGDVSRNRQLSRFVDGEDLCADDRRVSTDPCAYATCGAGGLCRVVADSDGTERAACACVPGATARVSFAPDGSSTVVCQDGRMSFMNPGESESPGAPAFLDPCLGFDCGANGHCVAMNLTPTCVCDQGYVATGAFAADGTREMRCQLPTVSVPIEFYAQRLPALPAAQPGGRDVPIAPAVLDEETGATLDPVPVVGASDDTPSDGSAFPMPLPNPELVAPDPRAAGGTKSSGCALSVQGTVPAWGGFIVAALALASVGARRRR